MTGRMALVAGATGLVGTELLRVLAADPAYDEVVALARGPLAVEHAKIRRLDADYARLDALRLDRAPDDAFCALGTTIAKAGTEEAFRRVDVEYVAAFARWARAQGATWFGLVSAHGADAASAVFYNRCKAEAEAAVAAVGFPQVEVFRPGLLVADRAESRPAERAGVVFTRALRPLLAGALRGTDPDALARAMVRAAKRPAAGVRVHAARDIARLGGGSGGLA